MKNYTKSEKEELAVKNAVECFSAAICNPNQNLSPIYAALAAANHYGTFGLIAVRKYFKINPDWTIPIYKSMGGIYSTY